MAGAIVDPVRRSHLIMAALVVIWGTAFAAIRELLYVLDPFELTWLRYVPMLVAYPAWLLWRRRERLRALGLRGFGAMGALGLLGVIGYHVPFNWGLQPRGDDPGVTAAVGAILVATAPLWALLWAVLLGRERFAARRAVGLAVAFAGVLVVVAWGRPDADLRLAKRAAVVLLAPAAWTLYSVLAKPYIERFGGLTVTGLTMTLGALAFAPTQATGAAAAVADFTPRLWVWLAFVAIAATAAGYAMWNAALAHLPTTQVASYVYLIPVVATATGYLFLDESVTAWFLLGGGLIIAGVWLVNRPAPKAPGGAAAGSPDS